MNASPSLLARPLRVASHERVFWPKITLQKLEVFCAVARLESVSRAAEQIGIAQPAVTAHLRALERKLGLRLVAPSGRNIVLTEAGDHVFRWATDIVTRSLELKHEISGLASGTAGSVVISASMAVGSYVLGQIITAFHIEYPGSRISTRISNPRVAIESVCTGDCDFAVLILDPEQPIEGLVLERLWQERLLLVAAPASRLVGDCVDPDAMGSLPFVTPPQGLVARDLEDAALSAYGIVRRNVVLEFGHPEPMKQAVRADVGVSLQLESAVREDIELGRLKAVPMPGLQLFQTVFLLYRQRKRFSALQRRLVEFIRNAQPLGLRALNR
jgi:DNA-binding transcriptional LysR family regulator